MPSVRGSGPPFSLLCFGFVVCGIVTVLPGPLLPVMAARWGLRDVQSGGFFAAEFLTSTVAAILSSRRLRWSLPSGYLLMTAGILLLLLSGETVRGHALALSGFGLIGLGTGLSVTATNLTVGSGWEERARRLSLVNLGWGIGAVACPWLVAAAERDHAIAGLLLVIAAGTAGMFLALAPLLRATTVGSSTAPRTALGAELRVLVFFAAFLFLYVGVETVVGGWITTYAHRFSGMTLVNASLMVSLYWTALLVGRGVGSVALRRVPERAILVFGLGLSLLAMATLVRPQSAPVVLAAVAVAGMGFGPVFPVGVSRMLARVIDQRHTGWVFAMCASGGAVLPWLTGLVSTRTGSLRMGFAVPVVAGVGLLVLAAGENAVLRKPASAGPAQTTGLS
jgi:fucose permease